MIAVALLWPAVFHLRPPAAHADTYNSQSPHWSHLNVIDSGLELNWIPDATTKAAAFQWFTQHVDLMMSPMDNFKNQYSDTTANYLRSLNPSIKSYGYDLDLTMCQSAHCDDTQGPNPYQSNLPEDQYLHFSQDTQVDFKALDGSDLGTVSIPGCPSPNPITAACRVQTYIWTAKRWVANVANASWQQWFADHLINEMTLNSSGQSVPVDSLELDEHGPGFSLTMGIGYQTIILSGGGVREYYSYIPRNYKTSGFYNYDFLDVLYNTDVVNWLSYVQSRLAAAGKTLQVNVAGYILEPKGQAQALAAKGVLTEHVSSADVIIGASQYQQYLTNINQVTAAGGLVNLSGDGCTAGPTGYTAGSYPTSTSRYQMWNLADYYLMKEPLGSGGIVYFNPNLCIQPGSATPLSFENDWLAAFERDVGQPQAATSVVKQGAIACDPQGYKVFGRQYDQALVLLRPRDGANCTDYGDSTAVSVPLPTTMAILQPDGTLSAPMTSVPVRNAEAVILFPVDATPPATVTDLQAH